MPSTRFAPAMHDARPHRTRIRSLMSLALPRTLATMQARTAYESPLLEPMSAVKYQNHAADLRGCAWAAGGRGLGSKMQ